MNIEPGYKKLAEVLQEALDQAQSGKGKERHATDNAYEDQLMCATQRLLKDHPCGGLAYQVIKKTVESGRLLKTKGKEAAQKELQGAINYLGGMHIIYEEEGLVDDKQPSLADLVDWSEAPSWATLAAQDGDGDITFFESDNIYLKKYPPHRYQWQAVIGKSWIYKNGVHLAHDWQTPLKRLASTPNPDNVPNDPTPSDCPTFYDRLNFWREEQYQKLGINCNDQKD